MCSLKEVLSLKELLSVRVTSVSCRDDLYGLLASRKIFVQLQWKRDGVALSSGQSLLDDSGRVALLHSRHFDTARDCSDNNQCSLADPQCADGLACLENFCCPCASEEFTLQLRNLRCPGVPNQTKSGSHFPPFVERQAWSELRSVCLWKMFPQLPERGSTRLQSSPHHYPRA